MKAILLIMAFVVATLRADTIIRAGSSDWNYMLISNGVDPALADTDFNNTWFNPTTGGYAGANFGRWIGPRPSELITTGLLFASAVMSWITFLDVAVLTLLPPETPVSHRATGR